MAEKVSGKVVCVVGPTATGKTSIAINISKRWKSNVISADSRQVYRGMDVVTGKDHPKDFNVRGVDIVEPDQECSVSTWHKAIAPALAESYLPVVVGGTGLYIRAVTEGIPTIDIPVNQELRGELSTLSVAELQERLSSIDRARLNNMNNSDRNNPRRLFRAIEVARSPHISTLMNKPSVLIIGLRYMDGSLYRQVVEKRVYDRIDKGAVEETEELLKVYSPNIPSMTAIGYRTIIKYLRREFTQKMMVERWIIDELNYAKRQMTWFRKVDNIIWFDAAKASRDEGIAKQVAKWYA